jgi:hypothetical protein
MDDLKINKGETPPKDSKADPLREVSCSKISSTRCFRYFYWYYVRKIPGAKNWKMHAGSGVDFALNVGYSEKAITGKDTPESILTDAAAIYLKANNHDVEWSGEGEDEQSVETKVIRAVKTFRSEVMPKVSPGKDANGVPLVQKTIRGFIKELGVNMVGVVDLIEDNGTIIDNKTSYGSKWGTEKAASSPQLAVYPRIINPENPPSMRFDVVSVTKTAANHHSYEVEPSEQREEMSKGYFRESKMILGSLKVALDHYNKTGDDSLFIPNTQGWWCSRSQCGYAYLCRSVLGLAIKE